MSKWIKVAITVFFGLGNFAAGLDIKDQTLDKPDLVKFLLPSETEYIDWWKVNPENFKSRVMESVDCWIVAIHRKNQLPLVWKNEALKYRGVIFFGKFLEEDLTDDFKQMYDYTDKPKVSQDF